ncbi:hypothetical protein [Pigmentiphaga litoralis]|uniref:hypothetical protein n=1 Tax=Pigmentiphaga litoralis TaxID=516702 RepID=UPI003B4338B2
MLVLLTPVFMIAALLAVRYSDVVRAARGCGPWSPAEVEAIIIDDLKRKSLFLPSGSEGVGGHVFLPTDADQWPKKPMHSWYRKLVVQRPNQPDEIFSVMVDCIHEVTYSVASQPPASLQRAPRSTYAPK